MKRFLPVAILFSVFGIFGCGKSTEHAGGPGSETTNGLFARVFLDNGTPAAYAGVTLRKKDFISSDTSKISPSPDIYADSLGNFELHELDSGDYRLTVSLNGFVHSRELHYLNGTLDLEQINLESPGQISGTIRGKEPVWVGIYGLDILAKTDSDGYFHLREIPAGNLKAFVLSPSRDSILADTNLTVHAADTCYWEHVIIRETPSDTTLWTLYEDFEDSALFAEKGWYFSDDSSFATITFPTDSPWNGTAANTERNGRAFTGTYTKPENISASGYVIFGTRISDEGLDLSELDSVGFYAKGSGSVRLAFERWEANASDNLKAWTANIPLSSSWTHYTVTPSDFLAPENDTLSTGWESVKKTVTRFHFFGIDGNELSLDDITIYGASF
mgnify:CR=1 FL=1